MTTHRPDERVDLHLHTTFSDGLYTPEQLVDLARRSGLAAMAITDHDTTAGIASAQQAANGAPEVIPAIEMTARYRLLDMHILGYFIHPENVALQTHLTRINQARLDRLRESLERLSARGVSIADEDRAELERLPNPTRRHLADFLVQRRIASSRKQAFQHYLREAKGVIVSRLGVPAQEAIRLIRGAGGVAMWAHPAHDCRRKLLEELRALGLQGIEVEYPGYRPNRVKQLRQLAREMNMLISGGSDCHGPGDYYRAVGARSVSWEELQAIRHSASEG
jgi:predicted metal-dependent phosphoesterase TrpH